MCNVAVFHRHRIMALELKVPHGADFSVLLSLLPIFMRATGSASSTVASTGTSSSMDITHQPERNAL
jgi:hypothetical protein